MKENKIEKLILDLSTRWDCSPQETVDRLNSMDESEINKLINSMTKKFQMGGKPLYGIRTVEKFTPKTQPIDTTKSKVMNLWETDPEKALELRDEDLRKTLAEERAKKLQMNAAKWGDFLNNVGLPKTPSTTQIQIPASMYKNGGMIDCLRNGGSFQKCKCGDKVAKVAKGAGGVRITQQQDVYPEMTVKRNDGVNGTFKREYDRYNNRVETLTQRRPDGLVMATTRTITPDQIDTSYTSGPINSMDFQQYVTPTKYKGMNFLQKMFNKVVPENWDAKFDRYKNGGELKKCGGSLKKKK